MTAQTQAIHMHTSQLLSFRFHGIKSVDTHIHTYTNKEHKKNKFSFSSVAFIQPLFPRRKKKEVPIKTARLALSAHKNQPYLKHRL